MNGSAPDLAMIERLKATQKWAIECHKTKTKRSSHQLGYSANL